MNARRSALAARRALLVASSAEQRAVLGMELMAWEQRAYQVDLWVYRIYRYRLAIAAAGGLALALGLRGLRGRRRPAVQPDRGSRFGYILRRAWALFGIARSLGLVRLLVP
jgi:hypothetical protein